jgi:hypothetical protein
LGLPNRLKLLRQRGPRIFDKISKSKGPIALLDESFLTPAQGPDSFYILCAVVVDKSEVMHLRRGLEAIAGRGRWHTTEEARRDSGKQKIRQLARLIAESTISVIAVVEELSAQDSSGESARARATQVLLDELAQNYLYLTGTVVYEKRMPGEMRARDEQVLKQIQKGNSPAANLAIWGMAEKSEPLLWAPDIVAWCYRQAYFERDPSFYQDLERSTRLLKV